MRRTQPSWLVCVFGPAPLERAPRAACAAPTPCPSPPFPTKPAPPRRPGEEAYAEAGPLLPRDSEEEDVFSEEELEARKC